MKKDLLLLVLLILPAFVILLRPGYFSMHDDLQSLRQLEMAKCFADGQIPCRWVPDMGYGYGFPLFNFYPSLPYLVGQLYHWLGLSYIDIVKVVGITGFILTAAFMYLLGREFWGRSGGVLSAVLYTYAPYHSVDFYVRGAMDEFWAMAFYPLIFWTTYKLIYQVSQTINLPSHNLGEGSGVRYLKNFWFNKWIPLVSLSVAGLMLSHNPMLMIFTPVYLVWIAYWWWHFRSLSSLKPLLLAGLFAFGLAAYFTLPVLAEQQYVHVTSLIGGYFNYLQHFVPIARVFFIMNWGYGASNLGQTEQLSFNLGYLHWVIPTGILILLPFVRRLRRHASLLLLLAVFALGAVFMLHVRSSFIWNRLLPLAYLQFPWRFLTLAVFAVSFLSGAVTLILSRRIFLPVLLFLVLALNVSYFHPRQWYPDLTDAQKFSGQSWRILTNAGVFDYLPIWAPQPPADPAGDDVNIKYGTGIFSILQKTSQTQKYQVRIFSPSAVVELQTYYFPGWRVWVDGREQVINPKRDPMLGRIQVDVTSGSHLILAQFTRTPVRLFADLLSAFSWLLILGLGIKSTLSRLAKRL